ncbi:MAG TPA: hypothetical protein VMR70_20575 [Flavisolibacter sp.]|nr:hypothetical protein [Flavisolibacter sp.]
MKQLVLIATVCLLLPGCKQIAFGGYVVNKNFHPVPSAVLTVHRTGSQTRVDANGRFLLADVVFNDTLLVTAPGFRADTAIVTLPHRGRPATIMLLNK